jgi:RNA polymerase sigma-70 factor (ECF subfamily)
VQPVEPARGDLAEELALRGLVADLDPGRRHAFVLTQVLGLSYADAAVVCGCPIGTIRSRVARAREQLIVAATEGAARKRSVRGHRS